MGAKKPSDRTHRNRDTGELNLTSLMDIITNLMFFLLIFANLIPVVIIDAPLPKIASTAEEVKIAKEKNNDLEVIIRINDAGFAVETSRGTSRRMARAADGEYPYDALHKYLIGIHSRNPKTKDVTLIPTDSVLYDVIIRTMDASREYIKGDAGYQEVPPEIAGRPESQKLNRLFPDVSLGGV